jgi:nicotinamide phosphoribosyltransferase
MFKPNSLFYTDGYKIGHKFMLAPNTTRLYGTWIPRSIKYAPKGVKKIVSFGQQLVMRWLHDEFNENFFKLEKQEAIKFTKDMSLYLGLEYDGSHFEKLHDLGYLPIKVKSLPEGIETLPNIPHMTFINTVDGFAWLTLYLETIISSLAWKPSTSATIALQYRRNVTNWVMKTDPGSSWLIPFLCHDFSARGLSPWDMLSSGLGHSTSFRGSDTLIVIPGARYFYGESENEVAINSVNASEHSVSTTKIFTVGEKQMILDWLRDIPDGIFSMVCDTFNTWEFIEYLKDPVIKERVLNRNGKLVVRPDSGDPVDIICGTDIKSNSNYTKIIGFKRGKLIRKARKIEDIINFFKEESPNLYILAKEIIEGRKVDDNIYSSEITDNQKQIYNYFKVTNGIIVSVGEERVRDGGWYWFNTETDLYENIPHIQEVKYEKNSEHSKKGVIELLWDIFGGTINEQGYKVLDPHIGAIYGDSITLDRQIQIYERLAKKGFASSNVVLGIGSFTYQMNTRDTLGFAAKGAWFEINNNGEKVGYDIYKDPVTDDGTKKSLKGFCSVHQDEGGEYIVKTQCSMEEEETGLLQTIYENGEFKNLTTLSEIRSRLESIL